MSDQLKRTFGEQLIRSQSISPPAEDKYHSEMQALIECRFSTRQRWLGAGLCVYLLGLTTYLFVNRHQFATIPLLLQPWLFIAIPLMSIMAAALCLWIAISGRYNRKVVLIFSMLLLALICGWGGIAMIEQGWALDDPITRRRLIFSGVTLLLVLGGGYALTVIEELHRRTEERLIRLEYRLAELSEKLDRQRETLGN